MLRERVFWGGGGGGGGCREGERAREVEGEEERENMRHKISLEAQLCVVQSHNYYFSLL